MAELALYRKYRPSDFSEVIGQDHIVRVLGGALKLGKLTHAYLFAGSRGTGKTSVARILARAAGCRPEDLYEIDAASARGIDEIRELREAVRSLPFASPHKFYIIDEVHMLTTAAFNALLKTLEEPPEHVIFILATTEFYRLPETIISRCQTFHFKKPSPAELKQLILTIAKEEKVKIEAPAAELIALLGDGSFRDAVGIFQQVLSASADRLLTTDEVTAATASPPGRLVVALVAALAGGDLPAALAAVRKASAHHYDQRIFIKLVLRLLRLALLRSIAPAGAGERFASLTEEEEKLVAETAKTAPAGFLPRALRELLAAYDAQQNAYLPELPLELALVNLLTPSSV